MSGLPELDHIFVMCDVDAPEATALAAIGLVEGSSNTHPGQGTACRRFFLPQQYLELVWVRDPDEAQSALTRPTRLWERWDRRRQGACPFGLIFSPGDDPERSPFPTWPYRPRYLPESLAIEIQVDTPITEPEFFVLPRLPSRGGAHRAQPVVAGQAITHLQLGTPTGSAVSPAARWAASTGLLSIERSDDYVLTITFDNASHTRIADLRPALPLILRW
jgi:Glyoxalase-like domain